MAQTTRGNTVKVPDAPGGGLDGFFHISERGSTVRTEVMAGITTWLTMAYILFVNPQILGLPDGTGLAFPAALTATALCAGVMTILMGVVGKYPFALAAGLGLNAFVAFSLVLGNGLSFPQAMGVIAVEGALITILVLTNVREMILDAIPMDLKRAIGIGIGAFIALIGLMPASSRTREPRPWPWRGS
jgi:AGZA family xanthine/uracil permease-like MFS transporter